MHAILPLKDLVAAKSRLGGILSAAERRSLMQAMVEDVLTTLAGHDQVDSITVVSDDPGAAHLCVAYAAAYLDERSLGCSGLNPVLEATVDTLIPDSDGPLMILHGDLPLLDASDISAVIAAQADLGGVVIGCDRAGSGTNLLAFGASARPRLGFGADSCRRHQQAAATASAPVQVLHRPGIGLDVDEPQDILLLLDGLDDLGPDSKTAALLTDTPLGRRLALALQPGSAIDRDNRKISH
ncbi:MAG: 2-phospho-L-lactate guanylyltransferase [Halieaceae bacterium]